MTPEERIATLEAKVTELVERNRKLANQIVGYGDRMQQTIAGIVKDAKVEALREAADSLPDHSRERMSTGYWLRARADNLESS